MYQSLRKHSETILGGIHNTHFSRFSYSAKQCLPPMNQERRLHQHTQRDWRVLYAKKVWAYATQTPENYESDKSRRGGRKYRNDHRAVPSGRSHVLGNIDVDGNTEMACLSHVSRGMRNWCTPWREGGALSSRGPRLTSEFLHFRVLMWEPAHIINGHVPRPVKNFRHTKTVHRNVDLRTVVCWRCIELSSSFDFVRSLIRSDKNLYVISTLKSPLYGHLLNFLGLWAKLF
jgi:hypothetical protein